MVEEITSLVANYLLLETIIDTVLGPRHIAKAYHYTLSNYYDQCLRLFRRKHQHVRAHQHCAVCSKCGGHLSRTFIKICLRQQWITRLSGAGLPFSLLFFLSLLLQFLSYYFFCVTKNRKSKACEGGYACTSIQPPTQGLFFHKTKSRLKLFYKSKKKGLRKRKAFLLYFNVSFFPSLFLQFLSPYYFLFDLTLL